MRTMLRLFELDDLMRRNSGRWMILDEGVRRSALDNRAYVWRRRPPKAFASRRYTFRVRRDVESARSGIDNFVLEGRHSFTTYPRKATS